MPLFLLLLAAPAYGAMEEECSAVSPELCMRRGDAFIQTKSRALHLKPSKKSVARKSTTDLLWLNTVVEKLWPNLREFIKRELREKVEPDMNKNLPDILKGLKFSHMTIGTVTPKLGPIQAYSTEHNGVKLKVGFEYLSDIHFEVGYDFVKAGVKNLQIKGNATVILEQFIGQEPLIGGVVVYFTHTPWVTSEFTGLVGALDLSIAKSALHMGIQTALNELIVLPKYHAHALAGPEHGVDPTVIYSLPPVGVMRVKLLSGETINNHDHSWWFGDKSDPFVRFSMLGQSWDSSRKENTLKPKWGGDKDVAYFIVHDREQTMKIEMFDGEIVGASYVAHTEIDIGELNVNNTRFELMGGGKVEGLLDFTADFVEPQIGSDGDFEKCFVVVKIFDVALPKALGDEAGVKAELLGEAQTTPRGKRGKRQTAVPTKSLLEEQSDVGVGLAVEKRAEAALAALAAGPALAALQEAAPAVAGASEQVVVVDRAMYLLVDRPGLENQMLTLTLEATGDNAKKEVNMSEVLAAGDRSFGGHFNFTTSAGPVDVVMRVEVWGLSAPR